MRRSEDILHKSLGLALWRAHWHNSFPKFRQTSSALQNSDSKSIKKRIMRVNYVVRPFACFWQHFAKIFTACMFVFDRLPMSIQMLPKPKRQVKNS